VFIGQILKPFAPACQPVAVHSIPGGFRSGRGLWKPSPKVRGGNGAGTAKVERPRQALSEL